MSVMTDELKEAVDRLQKESNGDRSAYASTSPFQWEKDRDAIVDAYLSEHLPDDDEPITAEWLESVQKEPSEGRRVLPRGKHWTLGGSLVIDANELGRGFRFWVSGSIIHTVKTRHDVRKLCSALGITL